MPNLDLPWRGAEVFRALLQTTPAPAVSTDESGVDLSAPLPAELAGTHHGWFSRYRRYPVFSRPWALGRMQSWGVWALGLGTALFLVSILPLAGDETHPAVAAAGVALVLAFGAGVPLVLGPWLAWQVRQRHWRPQREAAALVAAFAFTVFVSIVLFDHVRPAIKAALSRWIEGADAGTTVVMLNLSVQRDPPLPGASWPHAGQAVDARMQQAGTLWSIASRNAMSVLLLAWLAGATGLFSLQRERRALADLKRHRELQAAQQARREAELRLSVLQAQIEPHFLFNTLAGVRSAVTGDPARAVEIIDRLVDYLRASVPRLRSSAGEAEATLGAQLDAAQAYLSLMHLRLPRLSFRIDAPAALRTARCPPLLLITLVENAVKHGIEPQVGPGSVCIAAQRLAGSDGSERLEISVTDDGVGLRPAASGGGLGLANVRERLAQLYGSAAEFSLRSGARGGACATLRLPLEDAGVGGMP